MLSAEITLINAAIQAVCPIQGVSIGRWDDKGTWRIDFDPSATAQQRADAQAVVNGWNPSPPTADEARTSAFMSDPDRKALVDQVVNATPTQIKNYINNNVTDLASAKLMLIKLALLVALTIRT